MCRSCLNMDSILSVERELNALSEKFNRFDSTNGQQLVHTLETLRSTQRELDQGQTDRKRYLLGGC